MQITEIWLAVRHPIAHSQRCFGGEAVTVARPAENTDALPTNAASWWANNTSNTDSIKWLMGRSFDMHHPPIKHQQDGSFVLDP